MYGSNVDTHKDLGRIKLEHDIDMREIAYIAIRKFLDEYMKDGKLNEKGINYLEKKHERIMLMHERLEISCGEAPYLVSRYDTVSGLQIPVRDRIGIFR